MSLDDRTTSTFGEHSTTASGLNSPETGQGSEGEMSDSSADIGGQCSPWKVVKRYLPKLKNMLDVTLIRTQLWSISLIDYSEYCALGMDNKTKPELAEQLLVELIQLNSTRDFFRFVSVLETQDRYRAIARKLKKEAGDKARENGTGSQVLPFVMAHRLNDKLCDLAVDASTVDKIRAWDPTEAELRPPRQFCPESEEVDSQLKPEKSDQEKPNEMESDPDLLKSTKLISKRVQLRKRCAHTGVGSAGTVLLSGQVTEIAAWLSENQIVTDEEELGKLLQHKKCGECGGQEGEDSHRDDAVMTSGIYCVLPQQSSTLYLIVHLRWIDEPEVQLQLLRIALELSSMWLIFYNKAGIEQNGFCSEAYHEPQLPNGKYFKATSSDPQRTTLSLVAQLRKSLEKFPYGNNFIQPLSVLHIEYVFDVSLPFFSATMVYHNQLMEDSQAKCTLLTYEKFAVQSDSRTRNAEIAQIQQGIPDLTVGVSLRRELKATSVEPYLVDLRRWLQMSSTYVELPMLSCSSVHAESGDLAASVESIAFPSPSTPPFSGLFSSDSATNLHERTCAAHPLSTQSSSKEFPDAQPTKAAYQTLRGGSDPDKCFLTAASASSNDDHYRVQFAKHSTSDLVCQAMEKIMLPPALSHTLLDWRGPVQTIVCVAADVEKACGFLNQLTGSALGLFCVKISEEGSFQSTPQSQETTKEPMVNGAPAAVADSHDHTVASRTWLCCRPSDAMLYVLMCFDCFSLPAAAGPQGYHEGASLITAASLANAFVILTEGFPQDVDVIKDYLLPGLRLHGQQIAKRDNREPRLLNGILVPVTAPADLRHQCRDNGSCCSKHFRRICKAQTWLSESEELAHYFVGVQPVCSQQPTRTVVNLLTECQRCYISGADFQLLLRLALATTVVLGKELGHRQMDCLYFNNIMDSRWQEFRSSCMEALKHGELYGEPLGSETVQVSLTLGLDKSVLSAFPSTLTLGTLHEQGSPTVPEYSEGQRRTVQKVIEEVAEAFCPQKDSPTAWSYKDIPPEEFFAATNSALQELVARRSSDCSMWLSHTIASELFNNNGAAKNHCSQLISRFQEQWRLCKKPCQHASSQNLHNCQYLCLLPENHDQDVPHSCLDPEESHVCHHSCSLCKIASSGMDVAKCSKLAGHQHAGDDKARQHLCEQEHPSQCTNRCKYAASMGETDNDCDALCILPYMHSSDNGGSDLHYCANHNPLNRNRKCLHRCQLPGMCPSLVSASREEGKARCEINHWWGANPRPDTQHECALPADKHTCEKRCPLCKALCCDLHNHVGHRHSIDHTAVQPGIYEAVRHGENLLPVSVSSPTGEPCADLCRKAGRRHFHRVDCQCLFNNSAKHIHVDDKWDYVTHGAYWKSVQINDPCSYVSAWDEELEECTAKCHPECGDSYCSLKLFHDFKAPRTFSEAVLQDEVTGASCEHLLRGHLFPSCKLDCKAPCSQCEEEKSATPCCLRLGHETPAPSSASTTLHFTISQHVCESHSVTLCSRSVCPMCKEPCALAEHRSEYDHWCVHKEITSRQMAQRLRVQLAKDNVHPNITEIEFHTCAEICHDLGKDHGHFHGPVPKKDAAVVEKVAEKKVTKAEQQKDQKGQQKTGQQKDEKGQHDRKHMSDEKVRERRFNEESVPLSHERFWKSNQWSDPTLRLHPAQIYLPAELSGHDDHRH